MRSVAFILLVTFLSVGCGTPKMGLWKHQSGGDVFATDRPQDSALLQTEFGRVRVQPYSLNDAYGFVVKVWIENTSDKPVSYKYSDFKVQNQSGEIFDPFDEDAVKAAVVASVGNAALIAGGSYGMQSGVSADIWRKTKEQMLLVGSIPPKSTKAGSLFYSKRAVGGLFSIRISGIQKGELATEFVFKSDR